MSCDIYLWLHASNRATGHRAGECELWRILPDETPTQVLAPLKKIVTDPEVEFTIAKDIGSADPSSLELDGVIPNAIRELTREMLPEDSVVPILMLGGTDSRFLRAKGIQASFFVFTSS